MSIEFRAVSRRFADGTVAVENFSLLIPAHTTTVLVGSSGSGKTTLLRMVNRMDSPTSGSVLIDDEDVAKTNPVALRRRIGYVMQNSGLLPHRTVLDNVATVPMLTGVPRRVAHERALELLDTVGLDRRLAGRYPAELSGGQQQRVGVARALAIDPNILLMDEPFGAVDPIVRAELQQELLRLQRELDKTVVFVTHDINEAFLLADEVVILEQGGRIAQKGTPAEIQANPASDFVANFIGTGAVVPMTWLWQNLGEVLGLAVDHARLSVIPIVVAFAASVPLGWVANRSRVLRGVILFVAGVLFTVPSIALFILLPPLLGTRILDEANVVVALSIYGVALMARGGADAFAAVPTDVAYSATAIGFSRAGRFVAVELPLAGPVLLANLRVVAVSTVSLLSVGSLIGVDSLGSLFLSGYQRAFPTEILVGIVFIILLALVFDRALVLIGRIAMPWTRVRT